MLWQTQTHRDHNPDAREGGQFFDEGGVEVWKWDGGVCGGQRGLQPSFTCEVGSQPSSGCCVFVVVIQNRHNGRSAVDAGARGFDGNVTAIRDFLRHFRCEELRVVQIDINKLCDNLGHFRLSPRVSAAAGVGSSGFVKEVKTVLWCKRRNPAFLCCGADRSDCHACDLGIQIGRQAGRFACGERRLCARLIRTLWGSN